MIMEWSNDEFGEAESQLLLPLFEGTGKAPNNALSGLSRSQRSLVREAISSDDFEGKKGQRMVVWTPGCRVILLGMGDKGEFGHRKSRNIGARVMSSLSKKNGTGLTVRFTSGWSSERMLDFAAGMMLRDYEFLEHQAVDDEHVSEPWSVCFQASPRHQESLTEGLSRIHSVVGGVHLARDLGNEPANVLYPMEYARRAVEWADGKENVSVEVYDWDKLQELGMGGLINVGKGSDRKPCMVLFTLNPDADEGVQRPCIVGKGITFDTGGISIKPPGGMWDMKYDMCGGAAVFGAMQAISALKLPVRVFGVLPCAENMVSDVAYRPDDIITMSNGVTVEVTNTDAEGRLVLGDALTYACSKLKPTKLVDLATLTGGGVVGLGHF